MIRQYLPYIILVALLVTSLPLAREIWADVSCVVIIVAGFLLLRREHRAPHVKGNRS
jgi:hypothetical protein